MPAESYPYTCFSVANVTVVLNDECLIELINYI